MPGTAFFDDVKAALANNDVVLDVRNSDEVSDAGHITGSKAIPLPDLDAALDLDDDEFQSKYNFAKPSHDAAIITQCTSGNRAQRAADALDAKGFRNVKCYKGSFKDWVSHGGDVTKSESSF